MSICNSVFVARIEPLNDCSDVAHTKSVRQPTGLIHVVQPGSIGMYQLDLLFISQYLVLNVSLGAQRIEGSA